MKHYDCCLEENAQTSQSKLHGAEQPTVSLSFPHSNLNFEMKEHAVLLHEYEYGMITTEARPSIFLTSYIYAYSFQRKHALLCFPSSLIM